MLSNVGCGWCTITIDNFSTRASYLTDVPFDFLDALIRGYEIGFTQSIETDAEGWRDIFVFDNIGTFIIDGRSFEKEHEDSYLGKVKEFFINIDDLAKEIINDIETNIEEWVNWMSWNDDEEYLKERKTDLENRIKTLKDILDKTSKEKRF